MEDEKNKETAQEKINTVVDDHGTPEDLKDLNTSEEIEIPSMKHEEEIMIKKKYGGLLKKKPPLISKDHEHAYFDSADWALGKAGKQKSKGPLEALRPKLQPTPHQHIRTPSVYAPANEDEDHNTNLQFTKNSSDLNDLRFDPDNIESNNVDPMKNEESTSDDNIEINDRSPDDQNKQKI